MPTMCHSEAKPKNLGVTERSSHGAEMLRFAQHDTVGWTMLEVIRDAMQEEPS